MAYIVSKQNRFYVVTYDGLDPTTGKERRRWHLAGDSRDDAEAIAANLTRRTDLVRDGARSAATVTDFVNDTWFPQRVHHLRPSTAHRYRWMIDNYISPTIGDLPIRSLASRAPQPPLHRPPRDRETQRDRPRTQDRVRRPRHHARRTQTRRAHPSRRTQRRPRRHRTPAHRSRQARTRSVDDRPAPTLPHRHPTPPPLPGAAPRRDHRNATRRTRRAALGRLEPHHPFHLGRPRTTIRWRAQRRGRVQDEEQPTLHRPRPAHRNRPRPLEAPPATRRPSRRPRRRDLHQHRRRSRFTRNRSANSSPANSLASISRTIRFHDLRHTHATLLAGSSTPIKVVSERLGHAHPGFTMATYQHVMPGMGATAAHDFGLMLSTQRDTRQGYRRHTARPAAGRRLPAQIRKTPAHTDRDTDGR